jgi:hypothetical protein
MKHQQLTFGGEERKEQYTSTKLWTFSLGILSWKRNKSHGKYGKTCRLIHEEPSIVAISARISKTISSCATQHVKEGSIAWKMRMTAMVITGSPITTSCRPVFRISSRMYPLFVRHSMIEPAAPRSIFDWILFSSNSSGLIPAGSVALTACQKRSEA